MVTWGANQVFTPGAAPAPAAPAVPGAPPAAAAPAAAGGFNFAAAAPPAAAAAPGAAPSTPTVGSSPAPALFGGPALATPATPGGPAAAAAPAAAGGFSFAAGATPAAAGAAPAPAAGGLFGAASPAPAPATTATGGLFGSTPAAPAPAPAAGLFGASAPPAPPATGGLFGSAPAAAAPSAFGLQPAAAAPPAYGAAAASAAAAAAAVLQQTHRGSESHRLESTILRLQSLYSPTTTDPSHLIGHTPHHATQPNSLCQFKYVYYDAMSSEQRQSRAAHGPHHLPARPAHVDQTTWAEACARNPDPNELVPVVVVGAEALAARLAAQQQSATKLARYAAQLTDNLTYLRNQSDKSAARVKTAQSTHVELRSRLLGLMRRVELVRCANLPLQHGEFEALERVREVKRGVDRVGALLAEVEERGRCQVHAWKSLAAASAGGRGGDGTGAGAGGGDDFGLGGGDLDLSDAARAELFGVLAEQRAGLDALSAIVTRDVRDAGIAREEVMGGGMAGGGIGGGNAAAIGTGAAGIPNAPGMVGMGGAAVGIGGMGMGGSSVVVGRPPSSVGGGGYGYTTHSYR